MNKSKNTLNKSRNYPKGWYGKIATSLAYKLECSESYIRKVARGETKNEKVMAQILEYCDAHNKLTQKTEQDD